MEISEFRNINNNILSAIPQQSNLNLRREASIAFIEMLSSLLSSQKQNWLMANMLGIEKDEEFLWAMSIDLEALLEVSGHKNFTNIPHLAAILVKLVPYSCPENMSNIGNKKLSILPTEKGRAEVARRKIKEDLATLRVPEEIEKFIINQVIIFNDGGLAAKISFALLKNMELFQSGDKDWTLPLALKGDLEELYLAASMDSQNPVTLAAIYFKMLIDLKPEIKNRQDVEIEY